jgi:hypothetical protein
VAALTKAVPFIIDPLLAEMVVVWHAAQFVRDLGLQHMLLEDDSLQVISDLKKVGPLECNRGQLIFDTKLIHSSLSQCGF